MQLVAALDRIDRHLKRLAEMSLPNVTFSNDPSDKIVNLNFGAAGPLLQRKRQTNHLDDFTPSIRRTVFDWSKRVVYGQLC
jgi:hypothetical protein